MTEIMAHRGARHLWAENSALGFRKVAELGFHAVEFDLHLTDAGEVVVIHDPMLNRTTTATGPVRALTPAARQALRLKGPDGTTIDEGIPTFDEVLDILAPHHGTELFVELKSDENDRIYPGLTKAVVETLRARGLEKRAILLSFDMDTVLECRDLAPEFRRQICVDQEYADKQGGLEAFLKTVDGLVDYVAFDYAYLEEHLATVDRLRPRDGIHVWTVNDPAQIRLWLGRGLPYLTSDNPVLAREIAFEMAAE